MNHFARSVVLLSLFTLGCGEVSPMGADGGPDGGPDDDPDSAVDNPDAAGEAAWGPAMLLPISVPGNEFSCSMSGDALELYFAGAPGLPNLDLFVSRRATRDAAWQAPTTIAELNDAGGQDFTPSISSDGLTMWLASTRAGGAGGADIYVATRATTSSAWSQPTRVVELSTADDEGAFSVDASGLVGVFQSRRPGGPGGHDLYQARRSSAGSPWTSITQLVTLNTSADDGGGWLSPDGLDLYFFSMRNGPQDLFIASRDSVDDDFDAPRPITELNTTSNEPYPCVSADQRTIVFARSDTDQQYDLFESRR